MTTRTREETIAFSRPFVLAGIDEVLPAGAYSVETDEELLEGISFPVYRRVLTLIHLPTTPGHRDVARALAVDPDDLAAALRRDEVAQATDG